MKPEQILKQAIEKAIKNGYSEKESNSWLEAIKDGWTERYCETIIFSHDFAKAFWGEERKMCAQCLMKEGDKFEVDMPLTEYTEKCELNKHSYKQVSGWQYFLPELALAEDRLKYIEKFLPKHFDGIETFTTKS